MSIVLTLIYAIVLVTAAVSFSALMYSRERRSEYETMHKLADAKVDVGEWDETTAESYMEDTSKKIDEKLPIKWVLTGVLLVLVFTLAWLVANNILYNDSDRDIETCTPGTYIPTLVTNDGENVRFTSTDGDVVSVPTKDVIFASTEYNNGCYVVIRDEIENNSPDDRKYIVYVPKGRALTRDGVVMTRDIDEGNSEVIEDWRDRISADADAASHVGNADDIDADGNAGDK